MTESVLWISLASVLQAAAPIILAVLGETISERAGVLNLSMNGMILLAAMGSFAVTIGTGSVALGFLSGALIGASVAAVVSFASLGLGQSQVATGFVLAILCRDLAYFLGSPVMGLPGPRLPLLPVPFLKDIPALGTLFFTQDPATYASFILIPGLWFFVFRTQPGLMLRGIGESPAAAYVRGVKVKRLRYLYAILGGALAGLAGPVYSLSVKAGWKGSISGLDGIGWIALAITIFGGWHPVRAALGAYLFAFLQWLGLVLQPLLPGVPAQVLQVAPFPLMILTLLLVNIGKTEWMERLLAGLPAGMRQGVKKVITIMNATPPAALGKNFDEE